MARPDDMRQRAGNAPRPRMPQEIRDFLRYGRHAMILAAAAEHRVFDAVGKSGATAEQVRKSLKLDARATEILLNALAATGMLRKKGSRYTNTPLARRHLLSDSPLSVIGSLVLGGRLFKTWSKLGEVLRTGKAIGIPPWERKDAARETAIFTRAMYEVGFDAAAALPDMVDLSGCRSLLDVGGGPGLFSCRLCRRYPNLTATVFDLPKTIRETRKYLGEYDMGKRMRALAGNYNTGELPAPFDAVLLSHIIHANGEKENRRLAGKVHRCLNPGGMLILRDFLLNEGKASPTQAAVFAVNMLVNTHRGRTYTFGEVTGWLRDAGFRKIRRITPPPTAVRDDASVMTALKPGA